MSVGACAPDKGPGSVVIDFELGNAKSCADLGIDRLKFTVYQGSIDEPTVEYEDDMLCSDGTRTTTIESIEPGLYSVVGFGYDSADVATFDNQGQPEVERRVEIFEAAQTPVDVELTARPAQLEIAWRLGDGGFANCASVGIDRFEITAYEQDGGTVLLETVLDCELAGNENGYRLIDDPDRVLNGLRFGEVGIQPLDASGADVGTGAAFIFEPVGHGYPVRLRIECTIDECYEQP